MSKEKIEMTEKQFTELCKAVYPHLKAIQDQKIFDENGNAEYTDNPSGPVQDIDEPIDVFSEDVQEVPEEQETTEETSEEGK